MTGAAVKIANGPSPEPSAHSILEAEELGSNGPIYLRNQVNYSSGMSLQILASGSLLCQSEHLFLERDLCKGSGEELVSLDLL